VVKKKLKIRLFVSTEFTNVTHTQTDRHTDTAWRHRPRSHSIARQKLRRKQIPPNPCRSFNNQLSVHLWRNSRICPGGVHVRGEMSGSHAKYPLLIFMPPPGQTSRRRHYVLGLSVRPFVRAFVTRVVNMIFWKRINRFWCHLAQAVHVVRAWNG